MPAALEIIIPTYNRQKRIILHLKFLVSSIEENKLQEQILITVIDNFSDDQWELQENIKRLGKKYIKFIPNKKNIGLSESIKKGISLSSSEYLWLQSDDDSYHATALSTVLKHIHGEKPGMILIPDLETERTPLTPIFFDKLFGFLGSVVCSRLLLNEAVLMLESRIAIDNNYLIKAINYAAYSNLKNVTSNFPPILKGLLFQNTDGGSYFYNCPVTMKKTFWNDLIEVFKILVDLGFLSKDGQKEIHEKYFNNRSYLYHMRINGKFNYSDVIFLFRETGIVTRNSLIISIVPAAILRVIKRWGFPS